ncbi:hypothetical protein SLEP1_g37814 [Rubroshorea leprosula]|uniref:Uncharacterized protein n=1 Tax=Rubroshorea leprosula TaxID=152421 RepID=A0AAV5KW63_9ROSI|nr:hypothetical protein SLEP1_g37814 [Rubroshorea leprosula]
MEASLVSLQGWEAMGCFRMSNGINLVAIEMTPVGFQKLDMLSIGLEGGWQPASALIVDTFPKNQELLKMGANLDSISFYGSWYQ